MLPIVSRLANVLGTVRQPGDFFVSGTTEIPAPRLEVDGVGVVALPLLPTQAEQLVAVAERSPYGRGADTLVDTAVRRTWQIGADRVWIGGQHWAPALEAFFAAFYADCLHEVRPVTSGCRLTLVYNLLRKKKGPKPEPPSYQGEQDVVLALLREWVVATQSPDDDAPEKLVYPLEHAYTAAELGFDKLKGPNAALPRVRVPAPS